MLNRITRSHYLPIAIFSLFLIMSALAIYQTHSREHTGRTGIDPARIPQMRLKGLQVQEAASHP